MPPYVYFDRRVVNSVVTQFFHESMGVHSLKELGTNMEKNLQFPTDITIKKIAVLLQPIAVASNTQKDLNKITNYLSALQSATVQIQVADGRIHYFPLSTLVTGIKLDGAVHYTQATAGDGTLMIASLTGPYGNGGLDVNIPVPANTDFKFFIKQSTATDIGLVEVQLLVERP